MPVRKRMSRRRKNAKPKVTAPVASFVKKQINKNIETKYNNFELSAVPIADTPYKAVLNNLGQGTANNTRVGNSVRFQGVKLRYSIAVADTYNYVRVYLLWSKNDVNASLLPSHLGVLSKDRQNFKILYDRTHTVDSDDPAFITLRDINRYIGGFSRYNNTSALPTSGFLTLVAISDSSLVSHPALSYSVSITFQDA